MLALMVKYLKKEDMHHDQMNVWLRCFSEVCNLCNLCFYLCARSFFQIATYLTSVMINVSCFCKRPLSFSAFVKCSCCSVVGHLLRAEPLIEASLKDIVNILTFWIVFVAEYIKSSLSFPRYCATSRCQRNWNEIYRTSTLHVWHCWHIWFHCWSWLYWMVSSDFLAYKLSINW